MSEIVYTRDQAIERVVTGLIRYTVGNGAQMAPVLGAEFAATLAVDEIRRDMDALDVLGISEDDVRRVSDNVQNRRARSV